MRIITHTLESAGYQVIPAYGGEDAIRKAKTQKPDLVLTDLAMPKVSGVQVVEAIKEDPDTKQIPVIAVTAHVWDTIAQAAGKAGCDGYIAKPVDTRALPSFVAAYLGRGDGATR